MTSTRLSALSDIPVALTAPIDSAPHVHKVGPAMPLVATVAAVFSSLLIAAPANADGGCIPGNQSGLVPRNARAGDVVCATPAIAGEVQQENATAADRRDPAGAYGPLTCMSGFVWREAFDGDAVCVTVERRQETWQENANAGVGNTGGLKPQAVSGVISGNAATDRGLLAAVNDARLHPDKYPPHGDASGASMSACSKPFGASGALENTANSHNNYLATLAVDQANADPHVTPSGGHVWDDGGPLQQAGYNGRYEIVAIGQGNSAGAIQFWMQDDAAFGWGHRNTILNCSQTDAGASHLAGGPGGNYWTVDIGSH